MTAIEQATIEIVKTSVSAAMQELAEQLQTWTPSSVGKVYISKQAAAEILGVSTSTIDSLSKNNRYLTRYQVPGIGGYRLLKSEVENLPETADFAAENGKKSVETSVKKHQIRKRA